MQPQNRPSHLANLLDQFEQRGEALALLAFEGEGCERRSFAALAAEVRHYGRSLERWGLQRGDRVALVSQNSPSLITACFAALSRGFVAVPLDGQMPPEELSALLQDSGARLLLTTSEQADRIEGYLPAEVACVLPLDDPGGKPFACFDRAGEGSAASGSVASGSEGWPAAAGSFAFPPPAESASGDEAAILFYTSGTVGRPKGVPLSHRNLLTQIETVRRAKLTQAGDRILLPLPLHHVYPLVIGLLTPLYLGLPVILPRSLTGPDIRAALRDGGATTMIGVPRLFRSLYEAFHSQAEAAAGRKAADALERIVGVSVWLHKYLRLPMGRWMFGGIRRRFGKHLRVLTSGGGPLDPDLGWRLEALGWQVAVGYGLTETSPLLTMNPPGAGHLDSVGRPIPGVEIRIDEAWQQSNQDGSEPQTPTSPGLSPPREGEILARGPSVFTGYWNLPEKTAKAFSEDGWYRTGDLGFFDPGGRLHVTGRVSTLIITAQGEKVQPDKVESVYAEAAEIREIGIFQQDGKLVGVVVPETGQLADDRDLEEQVRAAVRRQSKSLPSYQRLADVVLTRKSLPRNRLGNLRRGELTVRWEAAGSEESGQKGPLPRDEMTPDDRELLTHPAAETLWDLLAEQFSDQPLTPDASLRLDLGIDSMRWLDLTMQIVEKTGVELDDRTLTRVETVRDLLRAIREAAGEIREGGGDGASEGLLKHPEATLREPQRERLQPLGPVASFVSRNGFRLNRCLVRWLLHPQVEGRENLPAQGPLVIAANHLSHLDPYVLSATLDRQQLEQTYWAARVGAIQRNLITRLGSRLARTIPIDRQGGVISSLALAAAVLQRDRILVWFPEGTRSAHGELQRFEPGLGLLLQHHPVPVVPVHLEGLHEVMPPGQRIPRRHPVRVRYGGPVEGEELEQAGKGEDSASRIVDGLRTKIARLGKEPLK